MDATALTVVSQLITDARTRYGAAEVAAIEVDASMLDDVMEQVLTLGGHVTLDSCVVDGVTIRERAGDEPYPVVHLHGDEATRSLTPLES